MRIAAIVITYNDEYKFREWFGHHLLYRDELYMHVIVDNGSNPEYLTMVEKTFVGSHIIRRKTNGGCTSAYNDGIRHALADPYVDAIMLIGNDIKLEKGGVARLYNILYSNAGYGMVSPVLLKKDSDLIESYGARINPRTLTFDHQNVNIPLPEVKDRIILSDSLPGGMNMAKRSFYELVGLQDEYLFMYSDEIDTGIRARKMNLQMVATSDVRSWHQHINPANAGARSPLAGYLWGRNEVYLAKKHFGSGVVASNILYRLKRATLANTGAWLKGKTSEEKIFWWYYMIGTFAGILNISRMPAPKNR